MGVIYCYTNKIDGKKYIGQTIDEKNRKRSHIRDAKRGSNLPFHIALREHGIEAFTYEILEECPDIGDRKLLNEREEHWITTLDTIHPKGYNAYVKLCALSVETRAKIGLANSRRIISPEFIEKLRRANLGKSLSLETREKLRQAHIGKFHSMKSIQKMKQSHLGKSHSLETREKMRRKKLGNKNWLGKSHSLETREKMRVSKSGTMWITNNMGEEKLISKNISIPDGWVRGRKLRVV